MNSSEPNFDKRIVEARLALQLIPPERMPPLAWDALEAGFDGAVIRRMAALDAPSGFETDVLLPGFMDELGLSRINLEIAYARLAQQRAQRILADDLDPLQSTAELERWWAQAGYSSEFSDLGELHDEVEVAFWYSHEPEKAIREWVRDRLRRALERHVP